MTLALDTDVLVAWAMAGAPRHATARALVAEELAQESGKLAIAPQILWEFVHVTTDARRFESPLTMDQALRITRQFWDSEQVLRIHPGTTVVHRTLELLQRHRLGRKRILDTAFAAAMEEAGVGRLATFNGRDYAVFASIEVVGYTGGYPGND